MKKTVELPIEWLEKLVEITDIVYNEGSVVAQLYGYVHSLDIYLKEKE